MDNLTLSKIYAKALLNKANKNNSAEKTLEDVRFIDAAITDKNKLNKYLDCPKVTNAEKEKFLDNIIVSSRVGDTTKVFFKILLRNNRFNYIADIAKEYEYFYYLKQGVVKAFVSYVHPLSSNEQEKIKSFLEEETGKKIKLILNEDKSIIGGIKVLVGNLVFDGSIKKQLQTMQKQMSEIHYV